MKTPKLPPLIIKKSPSAFYVYTYKNKWDPEKKRSYRASFKKVGTVTSGEKEGRIRWDDHFLAERPELRDFICERKGKDYGSSAKYVIFPNRPSEALFSKNLTGIFHRGGIDQSLINQFPPS